MYTYTAGATGLDAAMPTWVQDGGQERWIARLKQPAIRAQVIAEMRDQWLLGEPSRAGGGGTLLLEFKNPALPLAGKPLADVARARH